MSTEIFCPECEEDIFVSVHTKFLTGDVLGKSNKNNLLPLVPSLYKRSAIVYLEESCFGLPGIGSTKGAVSEAAMMEETGYLIEPENRADLAHILNYL